MQGEKLGKYEIRGILGRGAMGTVYEAWDPLIARKVAIKTVALAAEQDAEAREGLARFQREAQAAGRLQHPNIVGVFDYGETETLAYIVMEFVDGEPLKAVLDRGERFPLGETVRILRELLSGLAFSHAQGVVHRDIKPANIMLTRAGSVKIADFGIARIESSSMTQAGTVLGTPAYMSPEQFKGEPVDARTDLYSAGVVLYQLLTGERPFEGSVSAIMHKVLTTAPPKPSELAVTAPTPFDAVVGKAMAKRPEERFVSAAAFAEALRAAFAAGTAAPAAAEEGTIVALAAARPAPAPAATAATMPPSRNRLSLRIAAGVAALVLAGGGLWFFALRPAPPTKPRTVAAARTAPVPPAPTSPSPAPPKPAHVTAPAASAQVSPPSPPTTAHASTGSAAPTPEPAAPAPRATVAGLTASPESVTKAVAAALAPIPCTLIGGFVPADGNIILAGLAGGGAPAALHQALADAAPTATVNWGITTFRGGATPTYCRALDLLRPAATPFGGARRGFALGLEGGNTILADGDPIVLRLSMPDFPAWLNVDYFASDGSVTHLNPGPTSPAHAYAPGQRVTLGRAANGTALWTAGTPYGRDMIVAIASAKPLFPSARPQSETADAYLPALAATLAAAEAAHEPLDATALLLTTRAKP